MKVARCETVKPVNHPSWRWGRMAHWRAPGIGRERLHDPDQISDLYLNYIHNSGGPPPPGPAETPGEMFIYKINFCQFSSFVLGRKVEKYEQTIESSTCSSHLSGIAVFKSN